MKDSVVNFGNASISSSEDVSENETDSENESDGDSEGEEKPSNW